MNQLAQAIASRITRHVRAQVSNLHGPQAEYRGVFNGPPESILEKVYDLLALGGGMDAILSDGTTVKIPVLFEKDHLPPNQGNPSVGASGHCDHTHLLGLRNSPHCPRFVGLIPPGTHANLSQNSTRSDFGMAAQNNSGTASIGDWIADEFVQSLIEEALSRIPLSSENQKSEAKRLVEGAIRAADEVGNPGASRFGAWLVLSRVWSDFDGTNSAGTFVSLACGYPPDRDGSLDADAQTEVLQVLSSRLEANGFRPAIEQLKQRATVEERTALDQLLGELQRKCDVPTALARATPYYYGPFNEAFMDRPPVWWETLTLDRWIELLEEEERGLWAIKLECVNPLLPLTRGTSPVTRSQIELRIVLPDDAAPEVEIRLSRDVGSAQNHREWVLPPREYLFTDDDIPSHKTPIRYSATAANLKKGSLRIVSLNTWDPGFVVFARTASKISIPKAVRNSRDNVAFEAQLLLKGEGRHYLDLFVAPEVTLGKTAYASDDTGTIDDQNPIYVSEVSEGEYGMEVQVAGDCFYQLTLSRPESAEQRIRIYLSTDELAGDVCRSEFERLILLNRQREGRATTDVQMNRQSRCNDLQSWLLAKDNSSKSFYPIVLGPDYAKDWRARDWASGPDTVFSDGVFLSDPRPQPHEMQPPAAFIESREQLSERVRGQDENGLIEAARLGEWLATDGQFSELVEQYVRTYLEWLESNPESAVWCDLVLVNRFEGDGSTLVQQPDAVLVSPMHPVRFAWQCLAQRALFSSQRKLPCPAASLLDPSCVPDALVLPLRTASGGTQNRLFFSVEGSSDYWSILWNSDRLDRLVTAANDAPFDKEFGLQVGSVSSGFSVSQVHRALDDISEMLVAKPVLNVLVSSSAGQNNACNDGIISWCALHFGPEDGGGFAFQTMGTRSVRILDERSVLSRPEDAKISNLAEDTDNSVTWYASSTSELRPDLGIIAQLETSSASFDEIKIGSPVGWGGLIRTRVRQQLKAGAGAFLAESRMGIARSISGDMLADRTMDALVRLENLADARYGYTFAPSVPAIEGVLERADFAAVSSSAVDPACFLGGWLKHSYLWDYDLPSYSTRSGDSNGYYLLSEIKEIDRETLGSVLGRLPECDELSESALDQIILEIARRGIPTVRGLSSGDTGASGDLGLFIAARLLQDEFRGEASLSSILPVWTESEDVTRIALVIPVDPFRGYLYDLGRAIARPTHQRPDLIVAGIQISDTNVAIKLTPVEVKYRGGKDPLAVAACEEALEQAKSFSRLLVALKEKSDDPDLLLWKLAFQHLLMSILGFGVRVYSQQVAVSTRSARWSEHHANVMRAILSDEVRLEIDKAGRLIVIDASAQTATRDHDADGLWETLVLSRKDASSIVHGVQPDIFRTISSRVQDWYFMPSSLEETRVAAPDRTSTETVPNEPRENQSMPSQEATSSPSLSQQEPKETLTPPQPPKDRGVEIVIGSTRAGVDARFERLNLSDTNLNQLNLGIVGDLGTGKTQLLKSLVYQISQSQHSNRDVKPRVLIFDYKKDYSSPDFVDAVGARVVRPVHLPLNLFDLSGAAPSIQPWLDRFRFFSDLLDKIYSGIGPVQRKQLKQAVRDAYDHVIGSCPTIYDVHAHYTAQMGNKSDSVLSIIDDLVDMELFARQPAETTTFDRFLDGIVVVSLDALGQDDRSKNLLVAVMLNMFYEHMLRIPKRPYFGSDPQMRVIDSFLLVDEATNIMKYEFDVLGKLLLQGREFGVGVILASQYLRHFKVGGTDYREPLLTWFLHKVPNITPQELNALGLTADATQLAERIKSLAVHECLYKTFNVSGVIKGVPFYELVTRTKS